MPFLVYDTIGFVDTTDTILFLASDTLINIIDSIVVYPPDTGLNGSVGSLWIDNYVYINSTSQLTL